MRIYRKSKGIKEPEKKYAPYYYRKYITGSNKPYYKEKIQVLSDLYCPLNNIVYELYNKKIDKFENPWDKFS